MLWCRSIQIRDGVGYKVRRSTSGTILELGAKGGGPSAASEKRLRVKSVQGDYLTCHTWDGTTEETLAALYCAKIPDLRHSITVQTVASVPVTMSDHTITDGACTRLVTDGSTTQTEMVIPVWQLGTDPDAEVWAVKPDDGTGVTIGGTLAVEWIATKDSRAWCQID